MLIVSDQTKREISGTFCSERLVERWDGGNCEPFYLYWSTEESDVDVTRVSTGVAPFLNNHSSYDEPFGGVTSVSFGEEQLSFTAIIDETPLGERFLSRVENYGAGISFGSYITQMDLEEPAIYEGQQLVKWAVYKASKWELLEISYAPIPANPEVGGKAPAQSTSYQLPQGYEGTSIGGGTWIASGIPPAPKPTTKTKPRSKMNKQQTNASDRQLSEDKSRIQELELQLAELQAFANGLQSDLQQQLRRNELTARAEGLQSQATGLMSEMRITATEKDGMFGTCLSDFVDALLMQETSADVTLAEISGQLKAYASRQPMLRGITTQATAQVVTKADEAPKVANPIEITKEKARQYAKQNVNITV